MQYCHKHRFVQGTVVIERASVTNTQVFITSIAMYLENTAFYFCSAKAMKEQTDSEPYSIIYNYDQKSRHKAFVCQC